MQKKSTLSVKHFTLRVVFTLRVATEVLKDINEKYLLRKVKLIIAFCKGIIYYGNSCIMQYLSSKGIMFFICQVVYPCGPKL